MDLKDEFQKLNKLQQIKTLQQWDKAYYELDNPIVTDEEYDFCVAYFNNKNPSEKYSSSLGKASSDFQKYKHQYPVLSLAKITTEDGYIEYGKKFEYNVLVEPKIDGLTVVYYPDGTLVSRGDGHIGEILNNAKNIPGLPKPLSKPVRMEVCIDKDVYLTIPGANKNPRNLAAGILRRKDKTNDTKYLTYYAYNILGSELSEENQLIQLRQNGFKIVDYVKIESKEKFNDYFKSLNSLSSVCLAPTDGVVIKANLPEIALSASSTAHHPNNMVAFKFKSLAAETVITDIEWSRGRQTYTPVAIFKPVILGGSTVQKASLHNLNIMKQLNIKIGSKALVTLKNEIIPQIISCVDTDNSTDVIFPKTCPFCKKELEINESEQLQCVNPDCSYLMINDIERFVSKQAMNIMGISTAGAEKIAKNQYDVCPVVFVKMTPQMLSEVLETTYYSGSKIYNAIQESLKDVDPARFLYACNIPDVGYNTAKEIMKYYNNNFYDFLSCFKDNGKKIDGIGDTVYNSIINNFNKINSYLLTVSPKFKMVEKKTSKAYTFSITGKLTEPRKNLVEKIEAAGHLFSSSVTKKVDYLVCGEDSGSKAEKAKKYNIKVITEAELENILKKEG